MNKANTSVVQLASWCAYHWEGKLSPLKGFIIMTLKSHILFTLLKTWLLEFKDQLCRRHWIALAVQWLRLFDVWMFKEPWFYCPHINILYKILNTAEVPNLRQNPFRFSKITLMKNVSMKIGQCWVHFVEYWENVSYNFIRVATEEWALQYIFQQWTLEEWLACSADQHLTNFSTYHAHLLH